MLSSDGMIALVFNGEIYNYRELREELEAEGHRFYTSSDTETIVHAYERWGDGAFRRLRGMFGIALWDSRERTLWLARDRAGIKPLHYVEHGGRLYFGSEVKSLIAAGAVDRELDLEALDHYLSFLYAPADRSMFKGVRKLPPGHCLRWRNGTAEVTQFWSIAATETFRGSEREAAAALRDVLAGAVRSHMVSDVPLGAFLSGGVDSSIVVGLMAEASDRPVKTFSIGFDEPQFDELEHARTVATHFGTDHHEFVVRPDGLSILDRLIEHFDEPFADSSAIPTWYVSEIARRHVTVVLSGDGGDELFGGYDRYLAHPRVARFDALPFPGKRRIASALWPLLPHGAKGKNFLRHVSRDDSGRYLDSIAFFQTDEKTALYSTEVNRALAGSHAEAELARHFARFAELPLHSRLMRFDFETYLPEDVLTKVDRMSMATSLEVRAPLLDPVFVEWATSLPPHWKLRGTQGKYLLKKLAERVGVPQHVLHRRKQGFSLPLVHWMRRELNEGMLRILLEPRTIQRGYFEANEIRRLLQEHLRGDHDWSGQLWMLLMFEFWHRNFLETRDGYKKLPIHSGPAWARQNAIPVEQLAASTGVEKSPSH